MEDEEISAPLVFQCRSCNRIVGDSLNFISSDEEMQTITLQAASNISRSEDVVTSKAGRDIGSTFHLLHCAGCSSTVGRVYVTTPAPIDALRNRFTFDSDAVNSYELGKSEFFSERMDNMLAGGTQNSADQEVSAEAASGSATVALPGPELQLQSVQADLTKVQNLMLLMDERITKLEADATKKRKRN